MVHAGAWVVKVPSQEAEGNDHLQKQCYRRDARHSGGQLRLVEVTGKGKQHYKTHHKDIYEEGQKLVLRGAVENHKEHDGQQQAEKPSSPTFGSPSKSARRHGSRSSVVSLSCSINRSPSSLPSSLKLW
ncbi:unnamed protein product, partial [Phaeothamnion confervicola]